MSAADKQDVGCPEAASVVEIRHHLRTSLAFSESSWRFCINKGYDNSYYAIIGLKVKKLKYREFENCVQGRIFYVYNPMLFVLAVLFIFYAIKKIGNYLDILNRIILGGYMP